MDVQRHCECCEKPIPDGQEVVHPEEGDSYCARCVVDMIGVERDVLARQLVGAVDDAAVERLRASLWSTWGEGRQTTDWPSREELRVALVAAVGGQSSPADAFEQSSGGETIEEAQARQLRGEHAFGPHPGTAAYRGEEQS